MKKVTFIVISIIACLFVLTSCSNSDEVKADEKTITEYQEQVKELKVENGRLKIENAKLEKKITTLMKDAKDKNNK